MNILPLIISALLIMACVSASFFRERQTTIWEERSYKGFMLVERKARSMIARAHYKKASTKKSDPKEKTQNTVSISTNFVSHRDRNELNELSKLNISSLFSERSVELYEITAHLIKELYKDAPFFKTSKIGRLEYLLLDSMIAKAKEDKKIIDFIDFFPEDPKLRPIFYKMIKGTHGNYPPLGAYITIDRNNNRKPIIFAYASIPLLGVIFGKDVTQEILDQEQLKWKEDNQHHPLKKQELIELLDNKRKMPFNFTKIENFFEFAAKRAPQKEITAKDPETQITMTKEL